MKHFSLVIVALIIAASSAIYAHPSDGCKLYDLPFPYGKPGRGLPVEWSINDVVFPGTYPDPATLTDAEKYIIAGAEQTATGEVLFPWESEVVKMAERFYYKKGFLPTELNPEIIAQGFGVDDPSMVPGNYLELLKSPLTGEYPRLNALNPSPGDVFIHILTEEEKQHIAAQDQYSHDVWYSEQHYNPVDDKCITKDPSKVLVLYLRTYGWNGVIHTSLVSVYVGQEF